MPLRKDFLDALLLAAEEARKVDAAHVGTEHLLAGALRQRDSEGVRLLAERGFDEASVRAAGLPSTVPPRTGDPPPARYSQGATIVLQMARDMPGRHDREATLTHLLIALLRDPTGVATEVFEKVAAGRGAAFDAETLEQALQGMLVPSKPPWA